MIRAQEIGSCTDPETSSPESPAREVHNSPLELARNLRAPLATDTMNAEYENSSFWDDNGVLIQKAWKEWEGSLEGDISTGSSRGDDVESTLARAIDDAFYNPSQEKESIVRSLWLNESSDGQPLPKGVYATQLLTPAGIAHIRNMLDKATSSGIPTRRPNGMNRHGVIVDPDVFGAVPMKSLVEMVENEIINRIVRPVGRLLFPDRIGSNDDIEYFAFTIRYDGSDDDSEKDATIDNDRNVNKPKRDFELKEHRDASVVTLNINLNLPEEGYAGSEVYFRDYPEDSTDGMTFNDNEQDYSLQNDRKDGGTVGFSPGMAIIHLGAHRHGSLPISSSADKNGGGKRYNLVIWLFGKDGDVRISPYKKGEQMNVSERWSNAAQIAKGSGLVD